MDAIPLSNIKKYYIKQSLIFLAYHRNKFLSGNND
jgi:hypothetical protein